MKNKEEFSPIFPLAVNVLPGGLLPLQIFEPRYLDMIKESLANNKGFTVSLVNPSISAKSTEMNYKSIGTYTDIVDFNQLDNGLLGITVKGKHRVEIYNPWKKEDGLNMACIKELKEEKEDLSSEPAYFELWKTLKDITSHPEIKKLNMDIDFHDSANVAFSLSSLLPLTPNERQKILEEDLNSKRFEYLKQMIKRFGG